MGTIKYKLIFSILLSLCIQVSLSLITESDLTVLNNVLLWSLGTIYYAIFLYFAFCSIIFDKKNYEKKSWGDIGASLVITLVLVLVMPFKYQSIVDNNRLVKRVKDADKIIVQSTGKKNSASQGYEVWIEGLKVDKKDYNTYLIKLNEDWKFSDGRPMTSGDKISELNIDVEKYDSFSIAFRHQPNAGIVNLKIGNYEKEYDLYTSGPMYKENIDFKTILLTEKTEPFSLQSVSFYFLIYAIYWMIVLPNVIIIKKSWKKQKIVRAT